MESKAKPSGKLLGVTGNSKVKDAIKKWQDVLQDTGTERVDSLQGTLKMIAGEIKNTSFAFRGDYSQVILEFLKEARTNPVKQILFRAFVKIMLVREIDDMEQTVAQVGQAQIASSQTCWSALPSSRPAPFAIGRGSSQPIMSQPYQLVKFLKQMTGSGAIRVNTVTRCCQIGANGKQKQGHSFFLLGSCQNTTTMFCDRDNLTLKHSTKVFPHITAFMQGVRSAAINDVPPPKPEGKFYQMRPNASIVIYSSLQETYAHGFYWAIQFIKAQDKNFEFLTQEEAVSMKRQIIAQLSSFPFTPGQPLSNDCLCLSLSTRKQKNEDFITLDMVLGTVKVYAKSSFSQKVPLAGALRVSLMTGGMNQWSFRINPNDKIDIDPKKTLSAPILRKGKIMEPDFLTKLTQATTATHVAIFTAISGLIMPVISLADITYSTTQRQVETFFS